jgi:hypothetical protein
MINNKKEEEKRRCLIQGCRRFLSLPSTLLANQVAIVDPEEQGR